MNVLELFTKEVEKVLNYEPNLMHLSSIYYCKFGSSIINTFSSKDYDMI